jgi:hypothetical protein
MFRTICKLCCWNPELSKRNHFLFFVTKEGYTVQTTLKNILPIHSVPYHLSHMQITFVLTSGEEKVVITFESRFLDGKLPFKLLFTYAVKQNTFVVSDLWYCNTNRVIYVTNEVLISQHDCVFEQCTNDLNIPKQLANCKLFTKFCKAHPYTKNCFGTLYCTKKSHRLLGDPQCHCALCVKKGQAILKSLC